MSRLEELVQKELEGRLSRSEVRELQSLVDADPEAATHFRQLLDVEVELRNLDQHFDVADATMDRVIKLARKPKKKPAPAILDTLVDRWFYRIAIPAGVAAGLVISFVLWQDGWFESADFVGVEGSVKVLSQGESEWVSQGVKLRPYDRVLASPDSTGELRYRDDTQVRLDRGTEVVFEPSFELDETPSKSLQLVAGRIEAEVAEQPPAKPFILQTQHAYAIVRGTRFSLATDEVQTRLEVTEGQVDLRRASDGATVEVRAGMFAVVGPDSDLSAKPSRIKSDLIALYTFEKGDEKVLRDRSGSDEPLDLQAARTSKPSAPNFQSDSVATKILNGCQESRAITVEAWIRPEKKSQSGPARIVAFSKGSASTNFLLGQDGDRFIFRLCTTETKTYEVLKSSARASLRLTHLVFTRTPDGEAKIYINGRMVGQSRIRGYFTNWHPDLKLGLGNDPSVNRSWQGQFRLAAIYSKALSKSEVQRNFASGPDQVVTR
ncbi:MAG: LamG-like jellyroll fold domain-containing protein [Verrucomicrobiota bacterium]